MECGSDGASVFTRVDAYLNWVVRAVQQGECKKGEDDMKKAKKGGFLGRFGLDKTVN